MSGKDALFRARAVEREKKKEAEAEASKARLLPWLAKPGKGSYGKPDLPTATSATHGGSLATWHSV